MNNIFLSIVIPIYNGELYISHCLESIWSQGMDEQEYEVICVNDCSTDNTVDVIKEIQKSHNNLRLLSNTVNRRAGGSRNHGVNEAKGEYIVFIDADDYYHEGSLKKAVEHIKKQRIDILMCDFSRELLGKRSNILIHNLPNRNILTGRKFLFENGFPFGPCKFLFKRNLMIENHCYFEEHVLAEDVDWVFRIALQAKTMQYQPILLNHYVLFENSQTGANANEKCLRDTMACGSRLYKLSNSYRDTDNAVCRKILDIAYIYYKQGLKTMCLVFLPIKKKSVILQNMAYREGIFRYITKHSILIAILTNILMPLMTILVAIKRKYNGRL